MMEMLYRRLHGSGVWHFHKRCHLLNIDKRNVHDFADTQVRKPRSGEFCNECQAKARADKRLKRKRNA